MQCAYKCTVFELLQDTEIRICSAVFEHRDRSDRMSYFIPWTCFCHTFPSVFILYFVINAACHRTVTMHA
jgi:hypothetical protein